MKKNSGKRNKSQKKRLKSIFLRVVVITLIVCLVLIVGGVGVYNHFFYNKGGSGLLSGIQKEDPLGDINKTLAVFGVDEDGYRTDVIFVVNFDSVTNKVKVISVPRDTKVDWSDEQSALVRELKGYNVYTSKINEMTSYGGIEHIRDLTINEIESMLGIPVDNYVIVTIDAFKELVDAIGGVEVDVPALSNGQGLHYDDNYANLHIHLEPGLQILNGEQAEGLVRFRKGYAEGDVGRIKTQQIFLEAFAKKILSPSIITKIPQIANVIFNSVTTDVKLSDIGQYYGYVKKFDPANISFNIIPGEAAHLGSKWYFIADEQEMPQFIQDVLYGDDEAIDGQEETIVEDKTVSIQVLNSTGISGAAAKAKGELEAIGYTVANIDNYNEQTLEGTIIYAKDAAKGRQFSQYFAHSTVVQKKDLAYDVQIILGNDIQ